MSRLQPVTERWATDCSVFHGDSCPGGHATPLQLWRIAKGEYPARCPARAVLLHDLMTDHGMLP